MNKSVLQELLDKQKLKQVKDIVEGDSTKIDALYPHSPLNKTPETYLFEKIVHQIIEDFDKSFEQRKISFYKDQHNNAIIKFKDEVVKSSEFQALQSRFRQFYDNDKQQINLQEINLAEILNRVNFNHLELDKQDIAKYAEFLSSLKLKRLNDAPIPTYKQFLKNIKKEDEELKHNHKSPTNLKDLEYGEMLAINRYTYKGDYYMNTLLRNTNTLSIYNMPSAIIDTAIAVHGLNKLPNTELPYVIRYESISLFSQQPSPMLKKFRDLIKHNAITQEKAFISTSFKDLEPTTLVKTIFNNIKGKYIAPISQYKSEQEYLIPPDTQVQWKGYSQDKDLHIFTAEGVNVLLEQFREQNNINYQDKAITNKSGNETLYQIFSEEQLDRLPFSVQTVFACNSRELHKADTEFNFPIAKLAHLPLEQAVFFNNNLEQISVLKEKKFPVEKLIEIPFENAQYFITEQLIINALLIITNKKFPVEKLTEMPFEDAQYFIKNSANIGELCRNNILEKIDCSSPEKITKLKEQIEEHKKIKTLGNVMKKHTANTQRYPASPVKKLGSKMHR